MTAPARLAAAAAVAALAACNNASAPAAGALLNQPSALAVFRGVTTQSGLDPASPIYPYRPYLAIANSGSNDLALVDAITDELVPAATPLRGLLYPVPGRPLLLAAADLGDLKPDLLVAVTAGDVPTKGRSQLEVVRTWAADGAVVGAVELGADVVAIVPLPFDPAAPGTVQIAAALAGERIAVVTFSRSSEGDGTAIDVAGARVAVSAPLGFQPLTLAALPGDRTRVFAATREPIPPSSTLGVAEIDVTGTPFLSRALNALAPTRLVAAARLAEAIPLSTAFDESAFAGQPTVDRVYAILDESGCGLQASIACGVVALDPVAGALLQDPTPVGTFHAPFLAPIPIIGIAGGLAASGPPAEPPDPAEPQYAGTYLRVAVTLATRQTTAAAAVPSMDGALAFVDLGRWDVPSEQSVHANVKATVTSVRPTGTSGSQWLTLEHPGGGTVLHTDPAGLTTSVRVTAGYTPSDRWTVTREGVLPNLGLRHAEAGNDGAPWLALQTTGSVGVSAAVRLWDPTLGVHAGDTVVVDPAGLGTCGEFEATVADVAPPDAARPGGFVNLTYRTPTNGSWNRCLDLMTGTGVPAPSPAPLLLATFRASGYVLVRGTGAAALHVGRPVVGTRFEVAWQDETALAAACPLPPAVSWPAAPPACDAACRAGCEQLQRVRLARRVAYVPEAPADLTGPAVAFTLALEAPTAAVPRDLALFIDTVDGKVPFRVGVAAGAPVDPRAVVPFDRSPWSGYGGIRFLVPFAGGVVLDGTPTLPANLATNTIH